MSTLASYIVNPTLAITANSIRQMNKAYSDAITPLYQQTSFPLFTTQPNYHIQNNGFYKDLNKDKSVQKTLSKYYFYKIVDKWIYKELLPLLAFVDTSSDKPQLIKSLADYDVQKLAKDSEDLIEKKAKYMEEIIISKDMVRHVLKKICNDNQLNWYDLNKHEKKIKKVFYNYLLDKLKESIGKYGNKS